ncbi:hypothetical protein DPEC_G00287060 [Dallia pectoralis]|uniref:Uncharacterized protein n=1 Tax=Dallia pectoralis TaxID=75939 RepID=A0ACC2FK31_DALPE|nr:hypothetical protein DPEC_G00287060 [Dallia pectoralis]
MSSCITAAPPSHPHCPRFQEITPDPQDPKKPLSGSTGRQAKSGIATSHRGQAALRAAWLRVFLSLPSVLVPCVFSFSPCTFIRYACWLPRERSRSG